MWLPVMCPLPWTWSTTKACAPIGNGTGDPLFHRLVLNPLNHTSQGSYTTLFDFLEDLYLFIFRERGREGEREGEKYQCMVPSHVPLTGDLAHHPGMCPDWESNRQPFGSQAHALSTEVPARDLILF